MGHSVCLPQKIQNEFSCPVAFGKQDEKSVILPWSLDIATQVNLLKHFNLYMECCQKTTEKIDSHVQAAFNSGRGVVSTNSLVSLGYFCP